MRAFKWTVYLIVYLVLVVASVIFATSNSQPVSLDLMGYLVGPMPVWLFILASIIIGAFISAVLTIIHIISLELEISKLRRELNKVNETLKQERNEPINIGE